MSVEVITNSKGSNDWVIVIADKVEVFAGHCITPQDLVDILKFIKVHKPTLVEINDAQLEEGVY